MKNSLLYITALICIIFLESWVTPVTQTLQPGMQPQVSIDTKGMIRVVFGRNDSIFCATSTDNGLSFSDSRLVGHVKGMHLGMTRGPQLASSRTVSLVTAMDKSGDIHFFQLNHLTNKWVKKGFVNDARSSAPEGLMGIAADEADNFYAVWLDLRGNRRNKIYGAASFDGGKTWSKNIPVYISPEKTVCECCKPSVLVSGNKVYVMFRNFLQGNRNLYLIQSNDMGKNWSKAQKLGAGDWKLNGCPMDGGGLAITRTNEVKTIWRRESKIYTATPGQPEQMVGEGKGCIIDAGNGKQFFAWTENGDIVITDGSGTRKVLGKGSQPTIKILDQNRLICVYTKDEQVMATVLDI